MIPKPEKSYEEKQHESMQGESWTETIGVVAVTHQTLALQDPRSLNDKLTFLFELHQERHIHGHFLV